MLKKRLDSSRGIVYNTSVSSRGRPPLSDADSFCAGHGILQNVYAWREVSLPCFFCRRIWRCVDIAAELLINEEIRDREVRVIDAEGAQLGVLPIQKALELAEEAGLDLVKIVPTAQPPVCKLMDYDKHRFEQSKKEREMRKNQKVVALKEVQLSATIEENDVAIKAKNAAKFLQDGNKVKVSIRFRGRQIAHSDIGLKVMQDFANRTKDVGMVERAPMIEGRNMQMILVPKTDKAVKQAAGAKTPAAAPEA